MTQSPTQIDIEKLRDLVDRGWYVPGGGAMLPVAAANWIDQVRALAPSLLSTLESQAARVAELEGALRPFARAAANIPPRFADDRCVTASISLTRAECDELGEGITRANLIVSMDGISAGNFRVRARTQGNQNG
jgi:hypothetical protein